MGHSRDGAAASYRRHKGRRKKAAAVYSFKAPSGFEFQLYREISIEPFVVSGQLPLELATEAANALGHLEREAAVAEKLPPEEMKKMLIFIRNVVEAKTASPRITINPQSEDDLSADEVEWEDFLAIFNEAAKGGPQAESLRSFRAKQGQSSKPSDGGQGLRAASDDAIEADARGIGLQPGLQPDPSELGQSQKEG